MDKQPFECQIPCHHVDALLCMCLPISLINNPDRLVVPTHHPSSRSLVMALPLQSVLVLQP